MALSNKEKVGRALSLVAQGLRPFVDERMSAGLPEGKEWAEIYAARQAARNGASVKIENPDDPRFLLKILTDEWRLFSDSLNRQQSNLASELREVGNRWAHEPAITADDAYRALDTAERLLVAIGKPELAAQIGKMRIDHQRATFDEQTRKTVKAAQNNVAVAGAIAGTAIKAWREVITPHRDVATGQFNAAEFAADLHQVAFGQASSPEYTDPVEFFARTYVTSGLKDLLSRAVRRINGDLNASPVMNLQTQFGGGKTHSMLALYHLFSGVDVDRLPQAIQEIVGTTDLTALTVKRVALVGTHLSPAEPLIKPDGTRVNTLWGELAWQVGGRTAYDRIANADATGVPPGEALASLVRDHGPILILIDEWVAYARVLYGKENLPGGSFESQFTFAQHLIELVRAIPGAMLVVSIPASDSIDNDGAGSALEVGGANGRAALQKLQHVVGRTADDWRSATALESFEIVKRRLFEEPSAQSRADIAAVARQYVDYYRANQGQFPREATGAEYESRIKTAYPIHPELFDRLYEDWSTLEKFQRTRGVLRLMSTVINALWVSGDTAPLISPGSIPLNAASVFSELTHYLPDNWKPIVDTDIDGDGSTPVAIDQERPSFGSRSLTRRIARAAFIASAPTLGTAHKGVEKPRLWLGVAVPGDTPGHFGDSLEVLSQRATYLYSDAGRYWYDTTASISRQAADRADRLREEPEEIWAEVIKRLQAGARGARGLFAGVHVAPQDTGDVPDTDEARLVIIHPKFTSGKDTSTARDFAEGLLLHQGSKQRSKRNAVVMVAADRLRYEELDAAVREYLAWSSISRAVVELNLTDQQRNQAETRAKSANETVDSRISGTYTALLIPVQADPQGKPGIEVQRIAEGRGSLAERASEKLRRGQQLSDIYSSSNVRMALDTSLATVWTSGHVSFGSLWDLYATYPYLDRLRDLRVLEGAVLAVANSIMWQVEGFALAERFDEAAGRYEGLWLPGNPGEPTSLPDSALLVRPEIAATQNEQDVRIANEARKIRENQSEDSSPTPHGTDTEYPAPDQSVHTATPANSEDSVHTAANRVFFGSKMLNPERYAADFSKITQEVIQHLAGADDALLEVRIEISARTPTGFSESQVRTVRENANQLRFDQSGFEED